MKKCYSFVCTAFIIMLFWACSDNGSSAEYVFVASEVCPENLRGTFVDERDGQVYKYTTIGNQVWMAENLKFDDGSVCAETTCLSKGRIYGMHNALIACPNGWHLPGLDEWLKLFNDVGGSDSAGLRLKATAGWIPLNPGWPSNGTDDCGFTLLPIPASSIAGNSLSANKRDGYIALLWTSSRDSTNDYTMNGVFFETQTMEARTLTYYDGWDYLSIRCIKD